MVYLLNRYASMATASEFALNETEIDRTLPCKDDHWKNNLPVQTKRLHTGQRPESDINNPESLGTFSYYIEILNILSRIHNFLKLPINMHALLDVENWHEKYREFDRMLASWNISLAREYNTVHKVHQPEGSKLDSCGEVTIHGKCILKLCLGRYYDLTLSSHLSYRIN